MEPIEVHVGDVVRLRKPHPCGSYEWVVTRVGADIGLRCRKCNAKVMLTRRKFERNFKGFVRRAGEKGGEG